MALVSLLSACGGGGGNDTGGGNGTTTSTTNTETGSTTDTATVTDTGSASTSSNSLPECASPPFPADLNVFKADSPDNGFVDQSVTGTVEEVGVGLLAGSCWHYQSEETWWARIKDAGGVDWIACVDFAGVTVPVEVGQTITASVRYDSAPEFTAGSDDVTIVRDGQVVFYGVFGDGVTFEPPPGITFTRGEKLCYTDGGPGCSTADFALDIEAEGAAGSLAPGDVADVGPFEVHLGDNYQHYDGGGCDSGGYGLTIGMLRK